MRNPTAGLAGVLSLTFAMILGAPSEAARVSFIRDAEIENTIRGIAAPLFAAAGLDAESVRIYLIDDGSLNAFVAGGMRVFVHTGLLLAARSPNQVAGVIAHEVGHLAGGHLSRKAEALRNVQAESIAAVVLGLAVALAGAPGVGQAVMLGGQGLAQGSFLDYSRGEEQNADQFAVDVLARTGQSARGLLEFLELIGGEDAGNRRSLYRRTHPLTRDRIEFVRYQVATRPRRPPPPRVTEEFQRMQAKLRGFLEPAARTLARYPETDQGLVARYARAIAYYRHLSELGRALDLIDSLIAERPEDPYFHELKGQILFENGRVAEAVEPYRRAVALLPEAPLLRIGLAHVLIETGDDAVLADAAKHLEAALRRDRDNRNAWRFLSIAYGRADKPGLSALASAERALLGGNPAEAVSFATRAAARLPFGSPGQLRAEDVRSAAESALQRKKNR